MGTKIIKAGARGRHVEIPDGWQEVESGKVKRGDKFLNLQTLQWDIVEEDDLGLELILIEGDRTFDFLIREGIKK